MHIKKLEICGFKSFVDRTVIHFDHDMIGVVGPNGCGKSNVVDAIRWVMGEQSAKALRGKAMGDVIFNGSESRPQAGFAEVTITYDNSNPQMAQSLPVEYRDYAELSVTRRLYRGDGSNDYFINKVPVRLRDVTDVFLGTGVGRKAYSIVEQGKIGLIVSARPEDRRILIEEAAGITKYKARKRQAENKMKLTRQNLTRVTDIVSEIERQLDNLKRQAAKATRYVRYREELEDLVLWEASHKLLELIAVTGVQARACSSNEERVERDRKAVEERDAEIEVLREQAKHAETAAEKAQHEAFLSDNEVREHQAQLERAGDRYVHLDERLVQARDEQAQLEAQAASRAGERAALEEQLSTVEEEREREQSLAAEESEQLETLRAQATEADETLTRLRREEATAAQAITRAEATLAGHASREQEIEQRFERLGVELARLEGEHEGLGRRRLDLDEQVHHLIDRKQAMCDARDALGTELPQLREELSARESERDRLRSELQQKQSRLEALQELATRMEGLGQGVRNLLATGDDAVAGLMADRIEVPTELTAAIAGLAGDRLQCVVVDDLERALELLRELASTERGRATIIPRELPTRPRLGPALTDPGVIGLVAEQLVYAPDDEALVRALVGDSLLVKGDDDARRLRSYALDCDIVTLDGTVFHSDGRVSGGAGESLAAGMLEQKAEMRELEQEVDALREGLDVAEEDAQVLRERLAGLQEALDESKSEAHQAEIAMVTGQQDLGRLDQQLQLVARRRGEVAKEVTELDSQLSAAEQHEATTTELDQARVQRAEALRALREAESAAATCREELAAQQAAFTERKVALASIQERATGARAALDRVGRELDDLSQRIATLEAERDTAADEAGRLAAEQILAREQLIEARLAAREAQAAFENARLGLDDARHGLGLREAELREMRTDLEQRSRTLQEQQMELQRLGLEREHLEEGIAERFRGLELRRVVGDFHARPPVTLEEKGRIKELSRLIDRMGSVNLDAMKEFEESSERFEYYRDQRDDITSALEDLETAIDQMNRESERLFKHAYEGINRRFKEIFPKMFRGGRAELRLNNPDDMLETGIEILAQPPGKRVANLELMSGGEKAFTAVSLLLAIFRFKPSPFCILDEVDAPLDEANVGRYVEALRAMTDHSQFIIITHSKRTMEAVDVLYGVTMQEPGISKLVGVRVGDNASRSERQESEPPVATEESAEAVEAAVVA